MLRVNAAARHVGAAVQFVVMYALLPSAIAATLLRLILI
jgi:hypothetical protein